ncbi:MAG: ester cyclase [Anaerolineales bacterium]|jgi:steroid delta-isomerase-like uncharacterized protein|nr:ester cyclase [Anaerolineales bacterium]
MTTQELKTAVQNLNEISWHKRDISEAYDRFYAEEIVFHRPPFPPVVGKEANRKSDEGMLSAFSETKSTIHEIVAEGSSVTAHWTWQAVHTGTLPTLGVPATGKHIQFSGCSIYHFRDGKITEQWEYGDLLGFMQQLGVIPSPG